MPTKTSKRPDDTPSVTCASPDCQVTFVPKRSTAKYHSATCRQRAGRSRKAAAPTEDDAKSGPDLEQHGLVKAVRSALENANKLDTVSGQLALQLARRAAHPDESNLMALSKEIRAVVAEALGDASAGGAPPAGATKPGDDDVTRARKARDKKARQAAHRA